MDKLMKNKKGVELVTSLSLSCKTFLEKFFFWSDSLNLKIGKERKKTGKMFNILRTKRVF